MNTPVYAAVALQTWLLICFGVARSSDITCDDKNNNCTDFKDNGPRNDLTAYFSKAEQYGTFIAYLVPYPENARFGDLKGSYTSGGEELTLKANISLGQSKLYLASCSGPNGQICWVGKMDEGHFMEIHCFGFELKAVRKLQLPFRVPAKEKLIRDVFLQIDPFCDNIYWRDPMQNFIWLTSLKTKATMQFLSSKTSDLLEENPQLTKSLPAGFFLDTVNEYIFDWHKISASDDWLEITGDNLQGGDSVFKNYTHIPGSQLRLTVDPDRKILIVTRLSAEEGSRRHQVSGYNINYYGSYIPQLLQQPILKNYTESDYPWDVYKRNASQEPHYFNNYFYWRSESGAMAVVSTEYFYTSTFTGELFRDFNLQLNEAVPHEYTIVHRHISETPPSPCPNRSKKCSHICYPRSSTMSLCLCPNGLAIYSDNSTCAPKSLLYAHFMTASGNSEDLLLDPTISSKENRSFCRIQHSDTVRTSSNLPNCPSPLILRALELSNNIINPTSPGYQLFKSRSYTGVQLGFGGYLYRHPDNHRCIYLAMPEVSKDVPFYCSEEQSEILHFMADLSRKFPILLLFMQRKTSSPTAKHLTLQTVHIDNYYVQSEIPVDPQPTMMAIDVFEEQVALFYANLSALVYRHYRGNVVSVLDQPLTLLGGGHVDNHRSEFMVNLFYWLEMNASGGEMQLVELEKATKLTRVVLRMEKGSHSAIGFVQLVQHGSSFPLRNRRKLCYRCTESCLLLKLKGASPCLCPYTMFKRTQNTRCKGDIAYFAFYDDTLQLPLFGREKLAGSMPHNSPPEAFRVSAISTRMKQSEICWTYERRKEVHCRNPMNESKGVTTIGEIHPRSSFLLFSDDEEEMFYNNGNIGEISMYSFRVKQVYEFLPFNPGLMCGTAAWALDTEKKIVFWGTREGTLSYSILQDGTSGEVTVSRFTNVSSCVQSVAVDKQTERVFFKLTGMEVHWIKYKHIFTSSGSEVRHAKGSPPSYAAMTEMHVFGNYLFAYVPGTFHSSMAENHVILRRNLVWFDIIEESTGGISIQWLHAFSGDDFWGDMTRGLSLSNKSGDFRAGALQKVLFLSPPPFVAKFDPCQGSRCSHFCFPQSPLVKAPPKLFVCACPSHLQLFSYSSCVEKSNNSTLVQEEYDNGFVTKLSSALVVATMAVVIPVALFLWYRKQKQYLSRVMKEFSKGNPEAARAARTEADRAQYLPLTCIIPSNELVVHADKVLGEGNFGLVLQGTYNGIAVAVKTLKSSSDPTFLSDLGKEVKIMNYIGDHPNIVKLYGAEVSRSKGDNFYVVLELSPFGTLQKKLRSFDRKKGFVVPYTSSSVEDDRALVYDDFCNENREWWIDSIEFRCLDWAEQIAQGMQYLASKGIIHGDLAARNVLLFKNGVVKISDFGLSKRLYNSANYAKRTNTPLPWRWMAYESLKKMEFSIKSDVWSYGVTMWEMFSFGDTPLGGLLWNQGHLDRMEKDGFGSMIGKPAHALDIIYENLMLPCWIIDSEARIDFGRLIAIAKKLKEDVRLLQRYQP